MPAEPGPDLKFEIGHVLFIDIVGYTKLLINEQSEQLQKLTQIVRGTEQVRLAEAEGKLLRLPTGDGMALVFCTSPEAPVQCAVEISRALKGHPRLQLRMGIHSGPVRGVVDVNKRANLAGAGLNIAQRVMDCGDAGHILLSKHVAEDLEEYEQWRPWLHDLGTCEVKHGVKLHVVNLYSDEVGRRELPTELETQRRRTALSRRRRAIDSLAILPLANASGDPDLDYLSDGMTESIINSLSPLPKLRVMARSTVFRYKGQDVDPQEVGHDLGVRAVVTGRVLRIGESLIVGAELVDVADGSQLWGKRYNRRLSDIFTIQEEIAKRISEKLRFKLTHEQRKQVVKRHTENAEAYQCYLRGRYYSNKWTPEGFKKEIEYFNQAIKIDPAYALAYAGLADAYYRAATVYLSPREAIPKVKAAAVKAVELGQTLAEAHASLGIAREYCDWDWREAEREYERAIELNPNYPIGHLWYGVFLLCQLRLDESVAELRQAQQSDPLSLEINAFLALPDIRRAPDRAIEQLQKTIEMEPHYPQAHYFLGWTYEQKGEPAAAIAAYQKAMEVGGAMPLVVAALGHAYGLAGERDKAEKVFAELREVSQHIYVSPYDLALVRLGLGQKDQAFALLEQAYEERSVWMVRLNVYPPRPDSLHSDERFQDLLRRVGLPSAGTLEAKT